MSKEKFKSVAAMPKNDNWEKLTERTSELYSRNDDVRSPFAACNMGRVRGKNIR